MKKILSMILALAMVLSLGVTAFADNLTTEEYTGSLTGSVSATYTAGTEATSAGNIYKVNLTWTDVAVTYNGGNVGTYKWNTSTLKYELVENSNTNASWTDNAITITVENRSNASITATATYQASGDETLTFANNGAVTLNSAAVTGDENTVIEFTNVTAEGKAQTGTITGTMGGTITAGGTLGTITVSLTKGTSTPADPETT